MLYYLKMKKSVIMKRNYTLLLDQKDLLKSEEEYHIQNLKIQVKRSQPKLQPSQEKLLHEVIWKRSSRQLVAKQPQLKI